MRREPAARRTPAPWTPPSSENKYTRPLRRPVLAEKMRSCFWSGAKPTFSSYGLNPTVVCQKPASVMHLCSPYTALKQPVTTPKRALPTLQKLRGKAQTSGADSCDSCTNTRAENVFQTPVTSFLEELNDTKMFANLCKLKETLNGWKSRPPPPSEKPISYITFIQESFSVVLFNNNNKMRKLFFFLIRHINKVFCISVFNF